MRNYENIFTESKYHQHGKHPVRYEFLRCKLSVKEQDKLRNYLATECECAIRVKREKGISVFMSSQQSQIKCIKYCFNHLNIFDKFDVESYEIDLTKLK